MKRCPRCGLTKPLDQFHVARGKASGRASHCKTCKNETRKAHYTANRESILAARAVHYQKQKVQSPDALWTWEIKKTHGLSPEQWWAMLAEQDGRCYLCEQPLPDDRSQVYIDHDHSHCPTGRSCGICRRGMAHSRCNTAIGLLLDDPAMLRRVAGNLERAKGLTAALIMSAPEQGVLLEFPDVTAS